MNNKNNELVEVVYKEMFPTVEEVEHELTREWAKCKGQDSLVRNQQVGINLKKGLDD